MTTFCTCCDPRLQPLSEADTLAVMAAWLFYGNMKFVNARGDTQLLAMSRAADVMLERMVLGHYGIRRWHGIELNAAGLALWQQAHP